MRWEDERWVKVYTRDTGEWLALGWEAQALFLFALRKADRAGILKTGKMRTRGLAGMTGMPLDVVERAIPLLLDDGCMRDMDGGYIIPNFIAAQEARTSANQRKRDERERDRDRAIAGGLPEATSGMVIDAMAKMSRQDVTRDGHDMSSREEVTRRGHAGDVTPRRDKSRVEEKDLPPPSSAAPRNELRLEATAAPRQKRAPKAEKPTDPRHAPLVKALVEDLGFPWDSTASGLMASSVSALLARADEAPATAGVAAVPEVLRRGRIARSQTGYYSASSLPEFRKAWDRLSEPRRQGGGGPAPPSSWDLSKELPPPERDDEVPL